MSSLIKDRIRQRLKESKETKGDFCIKVPDGVTFFKPQERTMNLDIIPYRVTVNNNPDVKAGDVWYHRKYYTHYSIGPEEKAVICPKTVGIKCPVCEEVQQMYKQKADEDIIKAIRQKTRDLYNVIDLDDMSKGIQLFDTSYYTFSKMFEEELTEGPVENDCFAELVGGKTVSIRFKKGAFGKIEWYEASRIDFNNREQDYEESIIDQATNLDTLFTIMDYDQLSALFYGIEGVEIKEDEPEKEKPTIKRIPTKPKPVKEEIKEEPEIVKEVLTGHTDNDEIDYGENQMVCPKCNGSGESDSGRRCRECKGKKYVDIPEDEPEQTAETPAQKGVNKCPKNYTFGKDCSEFPECNDCDESLWNECMDEKDRLAGNI